MPKLNHEELVNYRGASGFPDDQGTCGLKNAEHPQDRILFYNSMKKNT
jgi:hypothetical protein